MKNLFGLIRYVVEAYLEEYTDSFSVEEMRVLNAMTDLNQELKLKKYQIDTLINRHDEIKEVLSFYANRGNYNTEIQWDYKVSAPAINDRGEKARELLKHL